MTITQHIDRLRKLITERIPDEAIVTELIPHISFIRDQVEASEKQNALLKKKMLHSKKLHTNEKKRIAQFHAEQHKRDKETIERHLGTINGLRAAYVKATIPPGRITPQLSRHYKPCLEEYEKQHRPEK